MIVSLFCYIRIIRSICFVISALYEVYSGYIVFVFSSICVCVIFFFFVKDFSETTAPRILKFGTNVGYDSLYCVRENQLPPAYHSLYLSFFLSLQIFCHRFLGSPMSLQIFCTP